jgi:hypothetical protein
MKIQYDPEKEIPLEVKRCYVPLTITDECPECGEEAERDYKQAYFSYPTLNVPLCQTFECECGHEWERWIQLDLTVKAIAAPVDDTDDEAVDDANTYDTNKEPTDASSS